MESSTSSGKLDPFGSSVKQDPLVITVIGAGAFGTALAQVAANCGNTVKIFARNELVVSSINEQHRNPAYLSQFELSEKITAYSEIQVALDGADFAILAIPTQLVRFLFLFVDCNDVNPLS